VVTVDVDGTLPPGAALRDCGRTEWAAGAATPPARAPEAIPAYAGVTAITIAVATVAAGMSSEMKRLTVILTLLMYLV